MSRSLLKHVGLGLLNAWVTAWITEWVISWQLGLKGLIRKEMLNSYIFLLLRNGWRLSILEIDSVLVFPVQ
jgi:hypothetical protein